MPDLVVDASTALAWGLPDESSSFAVAALAAVEQGIMHVPALWAYEVSNDLLAHQDRTACFETSGFVPVVEEIVTGSLSALAGFVIIFQRRD